MAVALPDWRAPDAFVDPHGGLDDLARRLLRTPGTPEQAFGDDPLRMLRVARFAAQLGFAVDPALVDRDDGDERPAGGSSPASGSRRS